MRQDKTAARRSRTWLSGVRPYALLAGLCLLLYLPGIASIPPLDRDESRFAQATRQMLQTGDFLDIRFQDEARNNKPAGIYWLQAAAVSAFGSAEGTAIWPYRLPSLAGATAAVLLAFGFGTVLFHADPGIAEPRRAAFVAAALLASALGVVAEAHIAKTDAVLLAAVMAGQGLLGVAYIRARSGRPVPGWAAAGFWIAEAAAILVKGPIAPGLAVVTAATLSIADRDLRWLRGIRPVPGIVLAALVLAPWLIAIEHATAGRFLADSLGHDLLAKLLGPQESHGAPPLSYLASSLVTFWPGSLFLVPALVQGWRRRDRVAARFLLAWIVPAWVILELVPTKLPHYPLPLYPALAFLAAGALADADGFDGTRWAHRIDAVVRALWGVTTAILAASLVVLPVRYGGGPSVVGTLAAAVLVVIAAFPCVRPRARAAPGLLAALAAVFALALGAVLPGLDRLWLSRSAAALVAAHEPPAATPLVAVGYDEPSLVFLLGTDVHLAGPGEAAALLAEGGEVLVSDRQRPALRQALGARGLAMRPLGNVRGIDYSNGRRLVLTLCQVTRG